MSQEQENELTAAEREIEMAMKALRPAAPALDPLAIAFAAGAARRGQSLWAWRAAAAVFAIALGVSLVARNQPQPSGTSPGGMVVQNPSFTAPAPTYVTMETRGAPLQWRLRERVLDQGLDALVVPIHSPAAQDEPVLRASDTTWRPS